MALTRRVEPQFGHWPGAAALLLGLIVAATVGFAAGSHGHRAMLTAAAAIIGGVLVLEFRLALTLLVVGFYFDSYLSGNGIVTPNKLLGLIVVVAWLVDGIGAHRRLIRIPQLPWLAAFVCCVLVSGAAATSTSVAVTVGFRYIMFVAVFIILAQSALERSTALRVVSAAVIGATLASIVGLAHFVVAQDQAAGPLAGADDFGFMLGSTLPVAIWWTRQRWERWGRLAAVPPVSIGACVLATLSRGAVVGVVAGGLWALSTGRMRIPRPSTRLIVAIAIAGALVLTSAVVGSALQRKQTVAAENISSRFYFWQVALDEFRAQPFTGVGPGNYTVRFTDFAPPFSFKTGVQTTHNAYLNILAELGIAGMLAFAGFLVTSIRDMTRRPDDRATRDLVSALATSFLIALVGSLFLTEQFYAPMWLWPALAAGVLRGSPAD